jgi:hypothetical protein
MGGTGLEPVTPSLSTWCSRSRQFAVVRLGRLVERNLPASERLSERERTPILAILATRIVTSSGTVLEFGASQRESEPARVKTKDP